MSSADWSPSRLRDKRAGRRLEPQIFRAPQRKARGNRAKDQPLSSRCAACFQFRKSSSPFLGSLGRTADPLARRQLGPPHSPPPFFVRGGRKNRKEPCLSPFLLPIFFSRSARRRRTTATRWRWRPRNKLRSRRGQARELSKKNLSSSSFKKPLRPQPGDIGRR